jgi:hypothetical protein
MKDRIDELNNEILDGTSSLNVDGLEFSSMEFKLFLTLTLLSWKVSDFFEIDPKDLQFTPNSFEFIIDNIVVRMSVSYDTYSKEFFLETFMSLYDPSFMNKNWLIIESPQIEILTNQPMAFYHNPKTLLEDNAILRTLIAVRNLISLQQSVLNQYIDVYEQNLRDTQFKTRLGVLGVIGSIGAICLSENSQDLCELLMLMGAATFLATLIQSNFKD